jgi:hypothetical protein
MHSLRKAVVGILLACFAACVAAAIFGHLYFYSTLPSSPDDSAGRTLKMEVNHGFVRYGSAGELRVFRAVEGALPLAAFPFLAAVFLGLKWGMFQVRK